jgi:hypothetical protein
MRFFRSTAALGLFLAGLGAEPPLHPAADVLGASPGSEVLSYTTEWRFIHAGNVRLTWSPAADGFTARLHLESAGMVSSFYKVDDDYTSLLDRHLCAVSLSLKASEGSRRHDTSVTFDAARRKASYRDRDLVKNVTVTHETDVQPCAQDVIGALYALRRLRLDPGRSAEIPVSDGKKAVMAKVEAQERETVKLDSGTYKTIRYEAFVFNNVLFRRSGRLFVWITDDDRRLPVQIRIRMPFYIGTVTLRLDKVGKT